MEERLFFGCDDRYFILSSVIGPFKTLLQCPSCLFSMTLRARDTFSTSVLFLGLYASLRNLSRRAERSTTEPST